jgi:hypothetical protein
MVCRVYSKAAIIRAKYKLIRKKISFYDVISIDDFSIHYIEKNKIYRNCNCR